MGNPDEESSTVNHPLLDLPPLTAARFASIERGSRSCCGPGRTW